MFCPPSQLLPDPPHPLLTQLSVLPLKMKNKQKTSNQKSKQTSKTENA